MNFEEIETILTTLTHIKETAFELDEEMSEIRKELIKDAKRHQQEGKKNENCNLRK